MEMGFYKDRVYKYIALALLSICVQLGYGVGGIKIVAGVEIYPVLFLLPFFLLYIFLKGDIVKEYTSIIVITFLLFIFMTIYGFVSVTWAQDKIYAFKILINYIYGFCLIYVMYKIICDKQSLYFTILINAYILIFMMIIGIIESITGRYFFNSHFADIIPYPGLNIRYPLVTFNNPNDFVFVLFGTMPFLNIAAKNFFGNDYKLLSILIRTVYFLLYCSIVFFASCRMGMLLIPVAIYINILLSQNRTYIKYATMFFAFFGILLSTSVWADFFADIENNARIIIWQNILKNAKAYFLMGTGPGNSHLQVYGLTYINGLLTNPHFWFLEILAEFGIFVFAVLLVWYYILIKRSMLNARYFKQVGDKVNLSLNQTALKFLIYFIFMSVMCASASVIMQFWLLIAFVVIAINLSETETKLQDFLCNSSRFFI